LEGEAVNTPEISSEALRCTIRQEEHGTALTVYIDARPFASETERLLWNEPDLYGPSDGESLRG